MKPLDLEAIRARADAAEAGPWFYNSYSAIFSHPLSAEYMRKELELDEKLKAEGRESVDEDFDDFPESIVASVRVQGGDTATRQGARDADFIAHAREDIPALLGEVARLTKERDEARQVAGRLLDQLHSVNLTSFSARGKVDRWEAEAQQPPAANNAAGGRGAG